ncbi:MAG: SatD family protein [Tabrizicola sp.]|jgi:hypothetical protein|nr:SatD family protein [Tabrizicola sp.]
MIQAVFTGDFVQSSRLTSAELDGAMQLLARLLHQRVPGGGRFTRFRGDGWQALLTDPTQSLDMVLGITAALRAQGLATRVAIGVGQVDSPGTADLSDGWGSAFVTSGQALDGMPKGLTLAIAGPPVRGEDEAIVVLLNERLTRWSREQAEAVAEATDPQNTTGKEGARKLGITPQAMSERLYNAGYPSMLYAARLWRDAKIDQGWVDP